MIGYRLQQAIGILKRQGLRKTIAGVWKVGRREAGASVPISDRLWLMRNGFKPASFVIYQFAGKSTEERSQYLSDSDCAVLEKVNGSAGHFLGNKLIFQRMLERQQNKKIMYPRLLAVLRKEQLIDSWPPYGLTTWKDVYARSPAVFIKPVWGNRGIDIVMSSGEEYHPRVGSADMIVVEKIDQADYSKEVFAESANTVRVVAFRRPRSREIFIPVAVHRFGAKETRPVDNWSRGGLSAAIDMDTGVLGAGIRHPSMSGWRVESLDRHPDTGGLIAGRQLPNWERLLGLTTDLMHEFPDLEFAAWDMLAVGDGWCVIEGNHGMDVDLLQVHKGLLLDARIREFVSFHCPKMLTNVL